MLYRASGTTEPNGGTPNRITNAPIIGHENTRTKTECRRLYYHVVPKYPTSAVSQLPVVARSVALLKPARFGTLAPAAARPLGRKGARL